MSLFEISFRCCSTNLYTSRDAFPDWVSWMPFIIKLLHIPPCFESEKLQRTRTFSELLYGVMYSFYRDHHYIFTVPNRKRSKMFNVLFCLFYDYIKRKVLYVLLKRNMLILRVCLVILVFIFLDNMTHL